MTSAFPGFVRLGASWFRFILHFVWPLKVLPVSCHVSCSSLSHILPSVLSTPLFPISYAPCLSSLLRCLTLLFLPSYNVRLLFSSSHLHCSSVLSSPSLRCLSLQSLTPPFYPSLIFSSVIPTVFPSLRSHYLISSPNLLLLTPSVSFIVCCSFLFFLLNICWVLLHLRWLSCSSLCFSNSRNKLPANYNPWK